MPSIGRSYLWRADSPMTGIKHTAPVYAIDVSGSPEPGNQSTRGSLSVPGFHDAVIKNPGLCTALSGKRRIREDIPSGERFAGRECFVLCVKPEQNSVLKKVYGGAQPRTKNPGVRRNFRARRNPRVCHGTARYQIQDSIMAFLHRYRRGFEDVVFETDGDCVNLLSGTGFGIQRRHMPTGLPMPLWANNRNTEPKGQKGWTVKPTTKLLSRSA